MSDNEKIIYILINEAMPGYVKIGKTSNLEQRIRSLDNTSTPLPFECFYACVVSDGDRVEKLLHDAFLDTRVRSNREFFEISPERVVSALKMVELEDVTPKTDYVEDEEAQAALNQARKKRMESFNFKMVDINPGAEIYFQGDESIKAIVLDGKNIEYNGNRESLSSSAQKILGVDYPVAGTVHWMYQGETMYERRERMEGEE